MPSMGKLIVIEGLDGSGKATQAALLEQEIARMGNRVRKISFPNYKSSASALVKMYLSGEFGTQPEDVNAYAASSFYAVDRYASWKTDWGEFYRQGGILVADRYATSNAIHQCVKLPKNERESFLSWLEDFEYTKLGIPRPDLVLYLDVDPEVSQELLSQRYENDDSKKDIHESNLQYMKHCREVALWCGGHLGWHRIECTPGGNMLSREDIAKQLLSIYKREI